jgi:hypothetical protein
MHHFNLVIYYDILITYFEKLLIINPLRAWPVGKRHFPQYLEHAMSSGVARECRGPSRAKGSNWVVSAKVPFAPYSCQPPPWCHVDHTCRGLWRVQEGSKRCRQRRGAWWGVEDNEPLGACVGSSLYDPFLPPCQVTVTVYYFEPDWPCSKAQGPVLGSSKGVFLLS